MQFTELAAIIYSFLHLVTVRSEWYFCKHMSLSLLGYVWILACVSFFIHQGAVLHESNKNERTREYEINTALITGVFCFTSVLQSVLWGMWGATGFGKGLWKKFVWSIINQVYPHTKHFWSVDSVISNIKRFMYWSNSVNYTNLSIME